MPFTEQIDESVRQIFYTFIASLHTHTLSLVGSKNIKKCFRDPRALR